MTVRVWICSYNNPELLKRAVNSWLKFSSYPITVWDNYSNDETLAVVRSLASDRVTVRPHPNNIGHGMAMAQAAACSEDFILFADNDVEILGHISDNDFKFCGLEGVFIPRMVEPSPTFFTVSRFHTSFLLVNRLFIDPSKLQEYRLPFDFGVLRYDTGAMLFHSLPPHLKAPLSEETTKKYVHFLGQSSKDWFSSMPDEVKQYVANCSDWNAAKVKIEQKRLWEKYTQDWQIVTEKN